MGLTNISVGSSRLCCGWLTRLDLELYDVGSVRMPALQRPYECWFGA